MILWVGLLSLLTLMVAVVAVAVLGAAGRWLGNRFRPDRISRKDERWLTRQQVGYDE